MPLGAGALPQQPWTLLLAPRVSVEKEDEKDEASAQLEACSLVMCDDCDCALARANDKPSALAGGRVDLPLAAMVGCCDACALCDDVCLSNTCTLCRDKIAAVTARKAKRKNCKNVIFTMCQVARHNR